MTSNSTERQPQGCPCSARPRHDAALAPWVLGFDAAQLPEPCTREIEGTLYVNPMGIHALLTEQVAAHRAQIRELQVRVEQLGRSDRREP